MDLLELQGTSQGFPYSSAIKESKFPLRELRVQAGGRPIRICYAFDPWRQTVLLLAGDKTGDERFYGTFVPKAEAIWKHYVVEEETRRDKKQ